MNLYEALGLDKEATSEQIKEAYKRAAQSAHPDKEGGDTEKFQLIATAYKILSNEDKKKQYDETGDINNNVDNKQGVQTQMMNKEF